MPDRVIGIDPSLTGTGIAIITADGHAEVHTITTKPAGDNIRDRDNRLTLIVNRLTELLDDRRDSLTVIEGPALSRGASPGTWDRAGLWWRIVRRLHAHDIPLAVCSPSTRAKWATGRGNASKAAVVAAIARMWPGVDLTDDNAADALVLASMAAQHLDMPVPTLARHSDPLAAVAWPDTLAA